MLDRLLDIPNGKDALPTRGGVYDPALNVWVTDGLGETVKQASAETRQFLQAMAGLALAAGKLHLQQLSDARLGHVWPSAWLHGRAGKDVISFCKAHPDAASPYACIDLENGRSVPYTHQYKAELGEVIGEIRKILALGGKETAHLQPYLRQLLPAFQYDAERLTDLAAMGRADIGWLEIADDAHWLLIAEFTETYADPLKHHIGNQSEVSEWAMEVAAKNGLGPWKTFFEFRLLEMMDNLVSSREIEAIRSTIRELYQGVSVTSPSPKARTEFRRALINAGHGANPPKSAKNYPNQDWIRAEYGYRNVVFANQAQDKVRAEMAPALQAAFDTPWSHDALLVDRMLRASALFIVAHEESHPWVVCNEASWLEELKCNALGMLAIHHCETIGDNISEIVLTVVAGALNAHRQQAKLMARGEMQLQDYYIGDVIFATFLDDSGYFVYDNNGMVIDVKDELAAPLVAQFVERILAIKRGESTASNLYEQFYRGALVFERFRILVE